MESDGYNKEILFVMKPTKNNNSGEGYAEEFYNTDMPYKNKSSMEDKLSSILIAHGMYGIENLDEAVSEILLLFGVKVSADMKQ